MIAFPVSELERCFAHSLDPVGFVDSAGFSVVYGNRAFERRLQSMHLAWGKHPLRELPEAQLAMRHCLGQQVPTHHDAPQWNARLEFLPVHLLHDDGRRELAVQCKLLELEPAAGLPFAQQVLESLPTSTWACTVNGELFWTSESSKRYAYGTSDLTQLGHQEHMSKIHPDDVQHASLNFSTGMADERMPYFRYRLRHHSGRYEWFSVEAQPVRAPDGCIRYWLGTSINIHAHVQEEARLKAEMAKLQQQLSDAQALATSAHKMELVSHLAGGVAHDLNNLLFVMRMHMRSMQSQKDATALEANMLAVQDCIRKAARLSTQLSGFSGRLPQNAAVIDPAALLDELYSLLTQAVGAEVELRMEVPKHIPPIFADRAYLENALINLLINARDAVDGRGQVRLHLDVLQPSAHDPAAPSLVGFHISDNGIGMSAELQTKVFAPFFTTKPPDRGTGLGLAMVKNFADNSGGQVRVQSTEGVGTTMSLYLPTNSQPAETPGTAPTPKPATPLGDGAVLLIEDDELVRQAVSMVLREQGYRIVAASNPEQAMGLLELGIRPDLILSDIRMPGKKTIHDLIRHVASGLPTPIIFITGYSADLVIEEGLIDQRYPVLFKPFAADELLEKIAEVIQQKG
jgi:PAS domain S-box-containing protein